MRDEYLRPNMSLSAPFSIILQLYLLFGMIILHCIVC